MVRFERAALVCILLSLGLPASAFAQIITAAISGSAIDDTKAVLPGVTVTVSNVETRVARTVTTDEHGRYRVGNLPPGNYEVQGTLVGFQTAVRQGIVLTIGREAVVELSLAVGDYNERLVVTGEAPLVDTLSGSLGDVVDTKTIQELPLNSRDLAQLVTLQTGAASYRFGREERGPGLRLSVGGGRPTGNVLLMDGVALESYHGFVPTGTSSTFLGVEAVREFKVESNAYSAEFGRSSGGVFNVITKSGTNDFHGSAFEFLRNEALDAKNFFDAEKPDFSRNQFGASLGGRIVRNKTFFFGSFEGLRERLGLTKIASTFNAAARTGVLGNRVLAIDPRSKPYLDLWPLPNGPDHGDGTADYIFSYEQPTNEKYYQGRVDHQISANDSIFARYTAVRSDQLLTLNFPSERQIDTSDNDYVTVEHKHIFSQNLLNTARFGYSNTNPITTADEDPTNPALHFVPGNPLLGALDVTGVTGIGQGITGETRRVASFQYIDDVSWTRGPQLLKFGVNWNHIIFDGYNPPRDAGNYTFNSIANFFAATPNRFRGNIAKDYSDADRYITQNIIGFYLQDDWRVTPNFTLNAGVRYEFITVPQERDGKLGNFRGDIDFIQRAAISDITQGNPWFDNPSLNNWAPRIGFAWDVAGDGKTAVRGGFGIFHQQFNQTWIRTTAFRMPPFLVESQATTNVPFPNIYQVCQDGNPLEPVPGQLCSARAAPDFVPVDFDTPYTRQYNVNVQRQISSRMVLTVGYVGSTGHQLPGVADVNIPRGQEVNGTLFFPTTLTRPNPVFDDLRMRYPVSGSAYNALQLSVNQRLSDGLQFRASYAFGKTTDDTSGSQTAGDVSGSTNWIPYFYEPERWHALSSFDVRHNFSFSSTYELPFAQDSTGAAGLLLQGWQLGGIVSLVSGFPGTVEIASRMTGIGIRTEFPDLVSGQSNNPTNPQDAAHYIDASSFAFPAARTMGTNGRNTIIQPGLANVDLSMTKNTPIGTKFNTQFRFEVFNLFNRPNFGVPDMIAFDSGGRASPTFGRITTTSTPSRQIQLGLKMTF